MTLWGSFGFLSPWLLSGLAILPLLWLILRSVPPAPLRQRFPAVTLLLGLKDEDAVSDRTPWWLLLLRLLAVAAMITGLAQPVLNPEKAAARKEGPLLIVFDGSWAGATQQEAQLESIQTALRQAASFGRPVALLKLSAPEAIVYTSAREAEETLAAVHPEPWQPTLSMVEQAVNSITTAKPASVLWVSDGLDFEGRDVLLAALRDLPDFSVYQGEQTITGLSAVRYEEGSIQIAALRSSDQTEQELTILAQGRDPAGNPAVLAGSAVHFKRGEKQATAKLALPSELQARITHFEIETQRSAAAKVLVDDAFRRREVALITGRAGREGLELLSPLHYLSRALAPSADLLQGSLNDVLPANPDVIVLADVATLPEAETSKLLDWVEKGGLLVRFAGPRLAASDISRTREHPLMPVRLRYGGRSVGGAMSWGTPKSLAPFNEESPFYGLKIPPDVLVRSQVVAQPDPNLPERVIAELNDGTPLVTRKAIGRGRVVLFHVTANAEWSSLVFSGLFVQMLERLAISALPASAQTEDLAGTHWVPQQVLDGFGQLQPANIMTGVDGETLLNAPTGPALMPGIYTFNERTLARNVLTDDTDLKPAHWPAHIRVEDFSPAPLRPLDGIFLAIAIALLALDVFASLAVSGRLYSKRTPPVALLLLSLFLLVPEKTTAQENSDVKNASELALAHVITQDPKVDEIALAGLRGLSQTLTARTSIEPQEPVGLDLETDELALFPFLYWPVTPNQPTPTEAAYEKLNAYLRSGGMIMFDTRDSDLSGFGTAGTNARKLQQLAAPLDIPALEIIPADHVLTRSFYLLQDFPGRHNGRELWVEAAPDVDHVEGMPFRNLNDGVTPVVIGGNDWAGAWAINSTGAALLPVGRGNGGARQRELALRFGVNVVMHVLTGSYKSDQVHVPALLERLGQ